ncbi:MAG: HisA/HisF-related TIM barrel protein [Actinomycetota bacterium]|nr:HisA/HisF-related TIM barrel protein [Actinomycetota bacterium]MDH5314222.1 HisA/HisF-related TIM barrel protein [Actinomycetota bacterium]
MAFEVIPAIDVASGRLALHSPGGPTPTDAFGGDALTAARAYAAAGARWLHVVDMDLAFHGEPRNLAIVRAIAHLGPKVQASGGVRSSDDIEALLVAGARRVVLGSGALTDEESVAEQISRFGSRLVVGIEVVDDRIRSRGEVTIELPLAETLGWLVSSGAQAFLVTALARLSSREGPDVASVKRVVRSGRPVVAAGGISTLDDLDRLRRAGAVGAVVGRAVLEGDLDLPAALALG